MWWLCEGKLCLIEPCRRKLHERKLCETQKISHMSAKDLHFAIKGSSRRCCDSCRQSFMLNLIWSLSYSKISCAACFPTILLRQQQVWQQGPTTPKASRRTITPQQHPLHAMCLQDYGQRRCTLPSNKFEVERRKCSYLLDDISNQPHLFSNKSNHTYSYLPHGDDSVLSCYILPNPSEHHLYIAALSTRRWWDTGTPSSGYVASALSSFFSE